MAKDNLNAATGEQLQCGALCWRLHKGEVEVLLLTSRDTGRWVIAKGWPMPGLSNSETAQREAWEEAGVEGKIDPAALGSFVYPKAIRNRQEFITCEVEVFALRVERLASRFPEKKQRQRKWMSARKAAKSVQEAGLAQMIKDFAKGRRGAETPLAEG